MNPAKSRSGKRSKKKRFHGNSHVKEIEKNVFVKRTHVELDESASARKLNVSVDTSQSSVSVKNRIIDINILFQTINNYVSCRKCHGDIHIFEQSTVGLCSSFVIKCMNCEEKKVVKSSRMIGPRLNIPEINRRSVFSMRCIGQSLAGLTTFCAYMGLPSPISQKAYEQINTRILDATSIVAENAMKAAALEETSLSGTSDITISGDGTWKTRGHSSLVGVTSAIGVESGKVIDIDVMSSFCKGCDSYKKPKHGVKFKNWLKKHSAHCQKNHTGSSGKMEVDGMKRMFQRSMDNRKVRYANYIGDGDTKTFLEVQTAKPYGSAFSINKIECVGHVQKRMGTRLRKLKAQMAKTKLSDGKTIGGKGRLTDDLIKKLTIYYGNAIRANKNSLFDMRKSIWAIWMHYVSCDTDPQHFFCPKDPQTWCKYNKAVLSKTLSKFKHNNPVPKSVMDAIKPIFKDLTNPILLKKCLGGRTQNPNESFNAVIWKHCPKTSNDGKKIAQISANIAVIKFNEGDCHISKVMNILDIASAQSQSFLVVQDLKRISQSRKRVKAACHEARRAQKVKKAKLNEKQELQEGKIYESGGF